ncbi:MAG: chromosomal replication initiator protein [Candidatus Berkelbacteria bacterium Athens1014_28]|uniref:Chromosomal replication initiator protein DnaA n=1 Tax=Candidatus Berkelbacteria bacterium Athens1014_28 TaxID=2017145 RepID=A0A554LPU5_9BACT|nr:MAG: chromosomal replication initiator protein [Candidatus Berkelbacteria bacterium Athens1014_28]
MSNEELWQAVLGEIELSISRAQFITWFKDTVILSNESGKVVVGVPNGFAKEWLENKFNANIVKAIRNFQEDVRELSCMIYNPQEKNMSGKSIDMIKKSSGIRTNNTVDLNNAENTYRVAQQKQAFYQINPRYTFENFIVGENNELARAACYAVSQELGNTYNPLFIYGGVGLGKTHLLQAIGNEVIQKNPEKNIIYISSERFTTELVDSIKNQKIDQFKEKYQKISLLIIDDIQFISGKEKTQDIFFHIFNFLYQLNKQIVISSDRPPREIQVLEDRLRSRFEGGMIVDVCSPDLETRMAILRAKSAEKNFFLEEDVVRFIAENIKNNIRELEGALNRVIASCDLNKKTPSMVYVKEVLSDIIASRKKKGINHADIIKVIAEFYGVEEKELANKGRKKRVAVPRQIAMYLIRTELNASYPGIGEIFGGRDHTTALHAFKKISRQIKEDEKLEEDIKILKNKIFSFN